jgi:hypothetical protein
VNGRKLRLEDRLLRRARYWRNRRANADTAAEEARLSWEQIRGDIADLPPEEQDPAWRSVSQALDRVGCQFDTRVDTPSAGPTRTDASRARTRGGERNTSRKERGR